MNVTLRDVAREAGVSVSTVSRVVRGTNYIDAATRQSVLDAIQKLQYRPNVLARRLKSGRTYTIGFVAPGTYRVAYTCDLDDPALDASAPAAEETVVFTPADVPTVTVTAGAVADADFGPPAL